MKKREIGDPFTDEDLMPFGKWKGTKMANIPADYLLWMYDNDKLYSPVKKYVEENMNGLKAEKKDEDLKKGK